MTPQMIKDLRRLNAMADKIDQNEAYFQDRHGDPRPDSVRTELLKDAAALRRVVEHVSKGAAKGAA